MDVASLSSGLEDATKPVSQGQQVEERLGKGGDDAGCRWYDRILLPFHCAPAGAGSLVFGPLRYCCPRWAVPKARRRIRPRRPQGSRTEDTVEVRMETKAFVLGGWPFRPPSDPAQALLSPKERLPAGAGAELHQPYISWEIGMPADRQQSASTGTQQQWRSNSAATISSALTPIGAYGTVLTAQLNRFTANSHEASTSFLDHWREIWTKPDGVAQQPT